MIILHTTVNHSRLICQLNVFRKIEISQHHLFLSVKILYSPDNSVQPWNAKDEQGFWDSNWTLICNAPFQWRYSERDDVSNHRHLSCLLNCLFGRRSLKTPTLRVTGLCEGNSLETGGFPSQRPSNSENVFIQRVSCQKGATLRMADRALLAGYPRFDDVIIAPMSTLVVLLWLAMSWLSSSIGIWIHPKFPVRLNQTASIYSVI